MILNVPIVETDSRRAGYDVQDMTWIVNVRNNYLYTFIVTAWLLKNEA